jgi:hypothetical protein
VKTLSIALAAGFLASIVTASTADARTNSLMSTCNKGWPAFHKENAGVKHSQYMSACMHKPVPTPDPAPVPVPDPTPAPARHR